MRLRLLVLLAMTCALALAGAASAAAGSGATVLHFAVTYPGDGSQHWSLVHREDLAEGYALAYEHGKAGERYLLADESRFTVKELAEAVAEATGSRAIAWPATELVKAMGGYGEALLNDLSVSSARARRDLGWVPRHASFVAEVRDLWREWQAGRAAPVR